MQRRSKEQIVSQILEVCCEGTDKTVIGYKTNLNLRKVNEYMRILVKNKLVEAGDGYYRTTSRGIKALTILDGIHNVLSGPGIGR